MQGVNMKLQFAVNECVTLRQWMKHNYPHIQYSRLQQAVRKGDVRVNGDKMDPSGMLQIGDICEIWDKLIIDSPKTLPKNITAPLIAKMDDFWVFDKPFGVPVQDGTKVGLCMVDIASSMMNRKAYPVHRLDRYTTGIFVIACDSYAARDLSETLQLKKWYKIYHGKIAPGKYPNSGVIRDDVYGKAAETRYKVLERNPEYSLVEFEPITGRMHQIRWHAACKLAPLLGDMKFGSEVVGKMCLRCIYLQLEFRGKIYEYNA